MKKYIQIGILQKLCKCDILPTVNFFIASLMEITYIFFTTIIILRRKKMDYKILVSSTALDTTKAERVLEKQVKFYMRIGWKTTGDVSTVFKKDDFGIEYVVMT